MYSQRCYTPGNTDQRELNSDILNKAKRILIKFGSSLLVNDSTGKVRVDWLKSVAEDVAKLQAMGKDVLVVSSGAIAVGRRDLGFTQTKSSMTLDEKQAAAAVGSIHLAHAYQEVLGAHGIVASQILVTTHDTEDRKRSVNARAAINTLLKRNLIKCHPCRISLECALLALRWGATSCGNKLTIKPDFYYR